MILKIHILLVVLFYRAYERCMDEHVNTDESFLIVLVCLFVWFLNVLVTTRLYRGRAQRQSVWQFYVLPHMRQSWETMTSISAGHIILTPTQPVIVLEWMVGKMLSFIILHSFFGSKKLKYSVINFFKWNHKLIILTICMVLHSRAVFVFSALSRSALYLGVIHT